METIMQGEAMTTLNSGPGKMREDDRILVLQVIDGTKPKGSTGLTDPRLFKGENNLHARMDTQTCLWTVYLDNGTLPQPLKTQWTSFKNLFADVKRYYNSRNIDIIEIKDH